MTQNTSPDAVSAPYRALLALYEDELGSLTFGDVDADALRTRAESVRAHAAEVEQARATLTRTQAALDAEQAALLELGERALRYATIFATGEDNEELHEALQGIELRPAAKPTRGKARRPKSKRAKTPASSSTVDDPEEGSSSDRQLALDARADVDVDVDADVEEIVEDGAHAA